MSALATDAPRDVPARGRAVFEKLLLDVAGRAVKSPVVALGLGGSAQRMVRADPTQDIDLIVMSALGYYSRLRVAAFGRTLDIFQETPDSIAAELVRPRRYAFLRLLAGSRVLRDTDDVLARSVVRARELLRGPAPPSIFGTEFELSEPVRDLAHRYRASVGSVRILLRGALLERVVDLAFARAQLWPVPLHRSVAELGIHDADRAARLARAIDGDDAELYDVIDELAQSRAAIRYGSRTRTASRRPAAVRVDPRALRPHELARLAADRVADIPPRELEQMSKLQLLTIQRMHAPNLSDAQRSCVAACLGSV